MDESTDCGPTHQIKVSNSVGLLPGRQTVWFVTERLIFHVLSSSQLCSLILEEEAIPCEHPVLT